MNIRNYSKLHLDTNSCKEQSIYCCSVFHCSCQYVNSLQLSVFPRCPSSYNSCYLVLAIKWLKVMTKGDSTTRNHESIPCVISKYFTNSCGINSVKIITTNCTPCIVVKNLKTTFSRTNSIIQSYFCSTCKIYLK